MTWGELIGRANKVANGLHHLGLCQGDRVALLFDNSPELLELILGTMIAGGVVVPLSGLMTNDIVHRMIASANARFAFVQQRFESRFTSEAERPLAQHCFSSSTSGDWTDYEPWLAVQSSKDPGIDHLPEASISILYTSGTSGVPKGMEHSHLARLLYPLVLGPLLGVGRGSIAIMATPMYHNGTWTTLLPTLYFGGTVVITDHFAPAEFQNAVRRHKCTHAFMVPTQIFMLTADQKFDASALESMQTIMISGAPLPPDTLNRIRSTLAKAEICEIYGMGEGFMTLASDRRGSISAPGSVGRPIAEAGTDIRIINERDEVVAHGTIGEIVGTSSFMLKGYYGEPELTRLSLWTGPDGRIYLRSGDLGYFDQDGFLHLAGRKKDMIISGGVKIYAVDLEEVFAAHPDVLEVAAIAIPHEKWGETPLLLAIIKPSAAISEDDLRDWGNQQLGKAQRVSRVEFRTSFPRNALDKVVKRTLREPYWTTKAE